MGKPKYWGAEGGKSDKLKVINAWALLNYWGAHDRAPPKVYAYANEQTFHVATPDGFKADLSGTQTLIKILLG